MRPIGVTSPLNALSQATASPPHSAPGFSTKA